MKTPLILFITLASLGVGATGGYFARGYLDTHWLDAEHDPFAKLDGAAGPYELHAFGRIKFHPASGRCWVLVPATLDTPKIHWVEYAYEN